MGEDACDTLLLTGTAPAVPAQIPGSDGDVLDMDHPPATTDLRDVLGELPGTPRFWGPWDDIEVSTDSPILWHPALPEPAGPSLIIVAVHSESTVEMLHTQLGEWPRHAWVLCGWTVGQVEQLVLPLPHAAVAATDRIDDATRIISAVTRRSLDPHEAELRRLMSLQRTYSLAIGRPDAVDELLRRLQKSTGAVCAVVDPQGRVQASTGALPLTVLLEQIRKTDTQSQHIGADGWSGHALRLRDADAPEQDAGGWLVVAARRDGFPDGPGLASMHIVATLVEAAHRIQVSALQQRQAIRAAIFDEALALQSRPESPELVGRMIAVGIDFEAPLVVVVAATGADAGSRSRLSAARLHEAFKLALEASDVVYLAVSRERSGVYLVQTDSDTVRRLVRVHRATLGELEFGVGREVSVIADIASSYQDGLLALHMIRAQRRDDPVLTFEEFDFATRVFASVGLEGMASAAQEFLAPVLEREPLLQALRRYFERGQNTNAAADALGIHHNTLRYRLTKVEEQLRVSLNEPAAISSVFLALTALDLLDAQQRPSRGGLPVAERPIGVTSAHLGEGDKPLYGAVDVPDETRRR